MQELKAGMELTLEQQFTLEMLKTEVTTVPRDELEGLLLEIYKQMLRYKNISCEYMRKELNGEVNISIELLNNPFNNY